MDAVDGMGRHDSRPDDPRPCIAHIRAVLPILLPARLRAQRRLSSTKIREARDSRKLETAQAHIDTMIGPLPTCTSSNRIRQEAGTCSQPEEYIAGDSEVESTHSFHDARMPDL